MIKRVRSLIVLGVLLLSVAPLSAQDIMEISYKNAETPATTLRLADIGKLWFADNMMQASSLSSPTQMTQLALSGISSIKFKNSQTSVQQLNTQTTEGYTVYDLQGRLVLTTLSKAAVNALPHGVYIVRSNNKTVKISK